MSFWLQNYFNLRKSERKGILVLLCLIVVVWSYPVVAEWIEKPNLSSYQQLIVKASSFAVDSPKRDQQPAMASADIAVKPKRNHRDTTFYERIRLHPGEIDLNKADSLTFMRLPGIGLVFASRIVRYRDLLGGFYSSSQLLEVYGMDSSRYQRILPFLSLHQEDISQIAINKAVYQQLRRHPYIRGKYASLIIQYRKQHGAYVGIEDLAHIRLFDQTFLRKIEPYLTFDP